MKAILQPLSAKEHALNQKTLAGIFLLLMVWSAQATKTPMCLQDDFDDQVRQLVANVSLPGEQLKSLPSILHSVEDTLKTVWPDCKLELYGSMVSGLAITTSDVDIGVTLPNYTYTDDANVLLKAKTAFENQSQIYQQVSIRKTVPVPVINLYYAPADTFCDVNFKSGAASHCRRLIHYLLHVDDRALNLAIIVKLWATLKEIKYLPRYSMTLLVIFLLQQRSVLPPVADLQKNVTRQILYNERISNVAFERKHLVSQNEESLHELLGRFFEYYDSFDFNKYIASTYTGRPIERSLFRRLDDVPEEFSLYKSSVINQLGKPMDLSERLCIQDPFEHSKCNGEKVNKKLLSRLKSDFKSAANLYRERRKDFLKALLSLE